MTVVLRPAGASRARTAAPDARVLVEAGSVVLDRPGRPPQQLPADQLRWNGTALVLGRGARSVVLDTATWGDGLVGAPLPGTYIPVLARLDGTLALEPPAWVLAVCDLLALPLVDEPSATGVSLRTDDARRLPRSGVVALVALCLAFVWLGPLLILFLHGLGSTPAAEVELPTLALAQLTCLGSLGVIAALWTVGLRRARRAVPGSFRPRGTGSRTFRRTALVAAGDGTVTVRDGDGNERVLDVDAPGGRLEIAVRTDLVLVRADLAPVVRLPRAAWLASEGDLAELLTLLRRAGVTVHGRGALPTTDLVPVVPRSQPDAYGTAGLPGGAWVPGVQALTFFSGVAVVASQPGGVLGQVVGALAVTEAAALVVSWVVQARAAAGR